MKKNVKTVTCAALSLMMANTCMTTLYAKDGDDTQTTRMKRSMRCCIQMEVLMKKS